MSLRAGIVNTLLKGLFTLQTMGRDDEFVYEKGGASFHCRKKTSDRFVVNEIFSTTYPVDITESSVVVDAGANIGAFTVYAAMIAKQGRVCVFEPDPTNHAQLKKNVELNKLENVTLFQDALAARNETRELFLSKRNKGASSMFHGGGKSHQINCVAFGDVFEHCGIDHIDVLKVDVEGAEYEILFSGSDEVFKRIDQITLEFHDFLGLPHRYPDLVAFLKDKGYTVTHCSSWLYRKVLRQGVIVARRV